MNASPLPVLDSEQRVLLKSTLNRIIPARSDLPGAGELEVASSIERTLTESVHLRRLFIEGLLQIQLATDRLLHTPFVALDPAAQTAVLKMVEQSSPTFFVALVEYAYRGYYTLAEVQRAVGWQPRPPQPLGYNLPPFDPSLLDQQRARAPFWRHTP